MNISWKNIENSLRYALKTSKITNFPLPPPGKRSRDSSIEPLEPWMLFKSHQIELYQQNQEIMCVESANFFYEKYRNRGSFHPQMPLTVKKDIPQDRRLQGGYFLLSRWAIFTKNYLFRKHMIWIYLKLHKRSFNRKPIIYRVGIGHYFPYVLRKMPDSLKIWSI